MERTIPHLALRAAKKLNPKLQCWRWDDSPTYKLSRGPGLLFKRGIYEPELSSKQTSLG